jgi:hypothetical protein
MKKLFLTVLIGFSITINLYASNPPDEGMWLPMFISRLNYVDMQKMGLHLTPEELYSVNNSSLKDAVVSMAGGSCTAEIISDKGLMLTNHHCGYPSIQSHSSVENDYLKDGFWAKTKEEELSNKDLYVSFLIRMEDVTSKVLAEVNDTMSESKRSAKISKVASKLKKEASEDGKYTVSVKSFFEGNEYYMFVYQDYEDIRLVGAPPSAVGKYGGDTDNWMWPRHTGDFSMFRIYTAPDGSPAKYSKDNIPLKPKHYFPISLKGIKKGDFAMIWGYPGGTDRYLSSEGVKVLLNETAPTIISIRSEKLDIMKEDMNADPEVKIKYAAKYAQCSNYWKYFIGQSKGLKALKVYEQKKALEDKFQNWADANPERKAKYGNVVKDIIDANKEISAKKCQERLWYFQETFMGAEILYFVYKNQGLESSVKSFENNKDSKETFEAFKEIAKEHFKNYNLPTDKKIFVDILDMYYINIPEEYHPDIFKEIKKKYKCDFNKFADAVYSKSFFASEEKINEFLSKPSVKKLKKDLAYKTSNSMLKAFLDMRADKSSIDKKMKKARRLFLAGLREMEPDKTFYPDANSTMRVTYGQVLDYYPADAIHYDYETTLKGIMEKEDSTNDEFIVPPKLKELYQKKDYGRYGKNGKLNVCFITNNDITGGNSGSPVLNGDGQIIGIAFDGNWEAMSGDIAFEPTLQRTISVDIRYVMFIIDKYAGATNLIEEMTFKE